MAKVRVFALATQLGLQSQALVAALQQLGMTKVSPATSIDEETARAVQELLAEQARAAREASQKAAEEAAAREAAAAAAQQKEAAGAVLEVPSPQAEVLVEPEVEVVVETGSKKDEDEDEDVLTREDKETEKYYRRRGQSRIDDEQDGLAELERQLAELAKQEEEERARRAKAGEVVPLPELVRRSTGQRPPDAIELPPVVTVLGHVDHGKTTLLDSLRKTNVVAGESGGITQHIGASEIETENGKRIVFIDTPGHEAFTAMRARGAMVTDIAILIVAADDGVMPQTVEAIKHVKAAKVPVIVAINKIDHPSANVERTKQQLLEHDLVPEEWGGDTVVVPISALTGEGLDELVDMILLVAEVQDLWVEPNADFAGIVIESSMDSSQGTICTVLIRKGELKVGDSVVCGTAHGRIRRLRTWTGRSVKEMGVGSPVEVIGLTGMPEAGEVMIRVKNPKEARRIAEEREQALRAQEMAGVSGISLRDLFQDAEGAAHAALNVIVKGDVWGTVQALESKLAEFDARLDGLDINVVATGVGDVTESDVMLARASEAIIIGFHVDVDANTRQTAQSEGVEIRLYQVIYEVLDDIQHALLGLLEPVYEDVLLGKAQVLELFRVSRIGVIAGCRITDGTIRRGAEMRVIRGGEEIFRGPLQSLKHFDQDVRSLDAPNECGISTSAFRGWERGDIVEIWDKVEKERKLPLRPMNESAR
ncbi:MAG: translation initiation factor IF-2 [Armatimonadetes bacterium]|nr:translation initiation factor IF-2 [Armatimonadota bacterium]